MGKITLDSPSKAELDKRIEKLESAVNQLVDFMSDVSEMDGMPKGQAGPGPGPRGPMISFKPRPAERDRVRISDLEAEMIRHATALNDLLEDKYYKGDKDE